MQDKYYKKLGAKIAQFVDQEKFTFVELGKVFEQYYLILLQEEQRDERDRHNGKNIKTHFCPVEKTTIEFQEQCNWCGEK